MDSWEALVQEYLTINRRLFINPQYNVGGRTWTASLDFLALDFASKTAWAVEVGRQRSGFADRAAQFKTEYRPRITHQLTESGLDVSLDDGWHIGLWLFSKEENMTWCNNLLSRFELQPGKATALESVARDLLSGKAWDDRHHDFSEWVKDVAE